MYDGLIKRLRSEANCPDNFPEDSNLMREAADAVEELQKLTDAQLDIIKQYQVYLNKSRWIPFETRPMDEEERQYYSERYGFGLADDEAVIYCSDMPDHGQEVLVCDEHGMIWKDIFDDDPDYGVGFETNGDMDGLVAWMPLPEPYEPPKKERA